MTDRFLKFIPSEEAMFLLTQKGHAFRLLTIIAESARRYEGGSDGLHIGEAFIGGFENYDMTEQNYRTAKEILVRRSHIKIVETCRTRKKVTTGATTTGTKVKLLSSTVYDINIFVDNDRSNDLPTTDQRPTNDKQEEQRTIELKKQQQTPTPLDPLPVSVVCSFSCLEGFVLSDEDIKTLCSFPEVDVIRAVQVRREYKKHVDSEMGFLLRAIQKKFQPKTAPKIELSDKAKSNRDKLMGYANAAEAQLKIKDLKIVDYTDHAMFGTVKLLYEHENFKELVKETRIKFNLWQSTPPLKLTEVIEEGGITHMQHAGNIGNSLLHQISGKN